MNFKCVSRSLLVIFIGILSGCGEKNSDYTTWKIYRGGEGSNAYSALNEINSGNVAQLKVAWTYRTGDKSDYMSLECSPIIVDDVLYGVSPRLKTFALDAKTGKQLWSFNPFGNNSVDGGVSRGLTYWEGGDEKRIFMFVQNKLMALDANSGQQIMNFGDSGYVDLNKDLRDDGGQHQEDVQNTSPGIIYKDLIITGSAVGERYEASPGHIRAYDVRTGKRKWIFHTVPQPGELGYDTWPKEGNAKIGGCNAWSGLSIDSKRGIVFAATGSASNDFHGGERIGKNLFANSVLAIDAATGKLKWHYQTLHHDIWDYDLPSPPNLVTIKKDGKTIDAVAQISKQGLVFIFNRETGEPIFPIEERPVPASTVAGEQSWPTQPFPIKPLPLCRQHFDSGIITDRTPEAHAFTLRKAKKYAWGDIYLPPSLQGILQFPGIRGGAEWSGACVDMQTGIMYVGINDIPNIVELEEYKEDIGDDLSGMPFVKAGEILFKKNCAVCHGEDRKGNQAFPPLLEIEKRLKPADVKNILQKPKGLMPSFNTLPSQDKEAIISYLFNRKDNRKYEAKKDTNADASAKGTMKRYTLKDYIHLTDNEGYPGVKPPWGTLNAVNLNTGELEWKIPLENILRS